MAIQLYVPTFDVEGCLSEIRECLEKGWTGMGYKTVEFEEAWKEYTGLPHAHFLSSATVGLNLAVEILKEEYKWNDNDEVITTSMTFVSTNHAILMSNLKPVFADIDDTLCLNPDDVRKKITDKTRAIIFVGMGGQTGKYNEIVNICKEYNLKLILDAAHMAGTRVNGVHPGAEADVVTYSFQAVKNLPTADSGMICFKNEVFDEIVRKKSWLGINKDTYSRISSKGNYKWRYDVEYVGHKAHGNSIMAAIGLVQLKLLDKDNAYRRQLVKWYKDGLVKFKEKVKFVQQDENCESAQHLFQIIVENRDNLLKYLNQNEIYPGVHYVTNTQYKMYSYAKGSCPKADYFNDRLLSLPLHMRLTHDDVLLIVKKIGEFLELNEK